MKVLIVAKTRQGRGACIGGISFEGRSVRLIAANAATDEQAGLEYEVGEVWEVEGKPAADAVAPHVENFIVYRKRRLGRMDDPAAFIERHMPAKRGGPDALYDGLTQATRAGALYIAERTGVPSYSTMFWRPDLPLALDADGKRIRYRYPTEDGGRTLTFVGFQEPVKWIPAGTLLRVSLAHWWRPRDKPEAEPRCYVQLSGWFGSEEEGARAAGEASAQGGYEAPRAEKGDEMAKARGLLKRVFGFDEFWPMQEAIIANVLAGRDTLAIMPTGSGKSLCYQLPALMFDGLTVVVSPLISLMQNQVDQLRELGVAAAFLNSTLDYPAYLATTRSVRRGKVKLLYLAPETLLRPETLRMLEESEVRCFVIDEAHCISSWGHDFRPEYRQLLDARHRFPQAVCFALTATATPRVQADIKAILGFGEANAFIASFDRPNLFLAAQPRLDGLNQVLNFLEAHREQSGVIYCSTRKQVDALTWQLQQAGWSALPYHAGLDDATRQRHQRLFLRDEIPIMVATVAFGMGIDKSNVRFVLHYNLPKNLESYYQEIGRAGRDGLHADCLLLYSLQDAVLIHRFIDEGAESERGGRAARLQAMLRYAQTQECRRRPLLSYFGETYERDSCEMCDNCATQKEDVVRTDVTVAAQKFLSCVARTGQVFGAGHIIKVLRGSKAQEVLRRRHHELSTYGIGMEYSAREWRWLAQQFIEQGLLHHDMAHGGLSLTHKGAAALKGQEKVYVVYEVKATEAMAAAGAADYDLTLFERLRKLRAELARAANAPPYMVFSDRTLMEMALYYPQSRESMFAIHGVGLRKMERYGDAFLAAIRDYCSERNIAERPKPRGRSAPAALPPSSRFPKPKRRFEEVGELFAAGRSIEDLQKLYKVKRGTIIGHLETYARQGHALDAGRVLAESQLSPSDQARVLALFDELGATALRPLYEALDERISWDELHLLRVAYWSKPRA